ncbi:MAG: hypothetical protein WEB04_08355 [Dehalococcoidia bacterium]
MEEHSDNRRRDDFIDIVRKDLATRPATATDLAMDDLLLVVNAMQYISSGRRRRFRDGVIRIANERGFEPTAKAARSLITVWRERAIELESVFHHIIDSVMNKQLRVATDSLPIRTRSAREQLQKSLRNATDHPSHRTVELRLSIELCVQNLGYDATFIEASRLTNDLRSDANDLESALSDMMFDDLCVRLGQHGQPVRRAA